ncbi:hypothetical protein YC2023_115759 [Brassica napus]
MEANRLNGSAKSNSILLTEVYHEFNKSVLYPIILLRRPMSGGLPHLRFSAPTQIIHHGRRTKRSFRIKDVNWAVHVQMGLSNWTISFSGHIWSKPK